MDENSRSLTRLLRPRSVAIVGISPERGSIGANALQNLLGIGFAGDIHLVSRTNRQIGDRACFASIDELPEGVDVAVLAVPRAATVEAVKACVRRKIGAAIVFAAGFAETDEAGRAEQERLATLAEGSGLALCGPNCIGLVNIPDKVALTFEPLAPPQAGEGRAIGVVTQSGAMCSTLRLALLAKNLNLSCVVSTGNEAQLTTEDFLAFLIDDEATRVIVLFMEQVRQPQHFLALAARARERSKPIVLLHPGRSARAKNSARTHTGAMADDHAVMSALVEREAVVLVDTLDELIDTAEILARFAKPPKNGAALMTNSGAFKGYALDFAETLGLDLPPLSAKSAAAIKKILPAFAAVENPIDVTAMSMRDAGILGRTAAELLADPAMGSLLIAIIAGAPSFAMDKANAIMAGIADMEKPIAVAVLGDETPLPEDFASVLRAKGLAFFRSADRALRAMARATWYGCALSAAARRAPPRAIAKLPLPAAGLIPEYGGKHILAELGVAVPQGMPACDPGEALDIARRIGFPVALKVQAAALAHKSDVGGVMLDIVDEAALVHAWDSIAANIKKSRPDVALDGMLVETMAPRGVELVVGAHRDPAWGPFITVGLGGIWVEALGDVKLFATDLVREDIVAELRNLKGAALLSGSRGAPAVDLDAAADCVIRLGALVRADPRIAEIEINPLRVYAKGALALDVLMRVGGA
jgi:acetate---CoA ligase (ADP-forming)